MIFKNSRGYRIFSFDLDGTLLDTDKKLTDKCKEALLCAHKCGLELVPTTGRIFAALPKELSQFPIRYYILVNGAVIYDSKRDEVLFKAGIPKEAALGIYGHLDSFHVLYDAYLDGRGYIKRQFVENLDEYVTDPFSRYMIKEYRAPLDNFLEYIEKSAKEIQKISYYSFNQELLAEVKEHIEKRFPQVVITKSLKHNSEINSKDATKGKALKFLADYLDVPMEKTIAIGDGTNDLSMIEAAGVGVAMGNAEEPVKEAADMITASCDDSGLAQALINLLEA